jgi:endo-1,4-beta-xylanase
MVYFKASLLACIAAASVVSADGLNARAQAAGKKYFGTEISGLVMNDATANNLAKNYQDFGQYTCENEMKFDALEPSRGVFSYGNADRIVAQAQANGQIMRCHNLVWHSQVPSWVTNGNFNNATLISIMKNHIANVVAHYKGKCYAWDVVNEALNEDGSYRSQGSVWGSTIGPAFIPMAFAAAAAADPAAKLYYNDYNCDKAGAKATGAQNLIRMVKAYGAPIHGFGMQGHFTTGQVGSAAGLVSNMQAFTALGVEVAYTELDIATPSSNPNFNQQATDYATVVSACKQVAGCVGITTWGITDKVRFPRSLHVFLPMRFRAPRRVFVIITVQKLTKVTVHMDQQLVAPAVGHQLSEEAGVHGHPERLGKCRIRQRRKHTTCDDIGHQHGSGSHERRRKRRRRRWRRRLHSGPLGSVRWAWVYGMHDLCVTVCMQGLQPLLQPMSVRCDRNETEHDEMESWDESEMHLADI